MKKRIVRIGLWAGIFLATVVTAYAITNLFFTASYTSEFSKKQVFQFDLDTSMTGGEIGPGDSISVQPVIYNDATENMYVFVRIQMSVTEESLLLYTFDADIGWTLVESDAGSVVYAYGGEEMNLLQPGESTTPLTEQMTMRSITNAEYAAIDDINITITGYAIGTKDVSTEPAEAWNVCKALGDIGI